jgi:hypothetical protein
VSYDGPVGGVFRDSRLLEEANLEDPPVFQIARRLRQAGKEIPDDIRSLAELCDYLASSPITAGGARET